METFFDREQLLSNQERSMPYVSQVYVSCKTKRLQLNENDNVKIFYTAKKLFSFIFCFLMQM